MWLQFLSHHIIGGGEGTEQSEELPCRERVSGPQSVFVQSATQILLLCSLAAFIRVDSVTASINEPPRDSTPPARVTINL